MLRFIVLQVIRSSALPSFKKNQIEKRISRNIPDEELILFTFFDNISVDSVLLF